MRTYDINREIKIESDTFNYAKPGRYKIGIKIIDIFGHDTTKVLDVLIGKGDF